MAINNKIDVVRLPLEFPDGATVPSTVVGSDVVVPYAIVEDQNANTLASQAKAGATTTINLDWKLKIDYQAGQSEITIGIDSDEAGEIISISSNNTDSVDIDQSGAKIAGDSLVVADATITIAQTDDSLDSEVIITTR